MATYPTKASNKTITNEPVGNSCCRKHCYDAVLRQL